MLVKVLKIFGGLALLFLLISVLIVIGKITKDMFDHSADDIIGMSIDSSNTLKFYRFALAMFWVIYIPATIFILMTVLSHVI